MSRVLTLEDFIPGDRNDGEPWTQARIEEAATSTGPFTPRETFNLATGPGVDPIGLDADPRDPQSRSLTTALAQLNAGYYRVVFIDAAGNEQAVGPVYSDASSQVYTSILAVRRVLSPDGDPSPTLGTAASLSHAEIEAAIAEAQAEVDARLASRYTVPFTTVPAIVEQFTRDIAAYMATLVYRRGDPIDQNDPVRLRYNRAQALLAQVQSGAIELTDFLGEVSETDNEAYNLFDGDLFVQQDFALGPALPTRIGIMPSGPFGGDGFDGFG